MLFLLDANVLIDANRDYYPIEDIPEFWDWILFNAENDKVKIPIEILEELINGNDLLAKWCKKNKKILTLDESAEPEKVSQCVEIAYSTNPNDIDVEKLGRDPFLLSYAIEDANSRTIVTTEISKPSKKGVNRKLPDACESLNIQCVHSFQFFKVLQFKTNWKSSLK